MCHKHLLLKKNVTYRGSAWKLFKESMIARVITENHEPLHENLEEKELI